MVSARVANLNRGQPSKSKKSANLPISQPQAAKMLSVSHRSLRDGKTVLATVNKRLISAVDDGDIAVSIAAKLADQDQATQDEAVANPDRAATIVKEFEKTTLPDLGVTKGPLLNRASSAERDQRKMNGGLPLPDAPCGRRCPASICAPSRSSATTVGSERLLELLHRQRADALRLHGGLLAQFEAAQ